MPHWDTHVVHTHAPSTSSRQGSSSSSSARAWTDSIDQAVRRIKMDPRRFTGKGNGKLEAFKFVLYVSSECRQRGEGGGRMVGGFMHACVHACVHHKGRDCVTWFGEARLKERRSRTHLFPTTAHSHAAHTQQSPWWPRSSTARPTTCRRSCSRCVDRATLLAVITAAD